MKEFLGHPNLDSMDSPVSRSNPLVRSARSQDSQAVTYRVVHGFPMAVVGEKLGESVDRQDATDRPGPGGGRMFDIFIEGYALFSPPLDHPPQLSRKRCVQPPQLIAVYHDLFLWVRPFLRTDWVISKTVGPGRHVGFEDHELRQVWARYALAGGPLVIEEVIDSFRRNARPKDQPRLSVYLRKDADVRHELQAELAGLVIPMSGNGYAWHAEFGFRLREIGACSDRDQAQLAMQELRSDIIDVGRKVLAGEPLALPPLREPSKPSTESPSEPVEDAAAESRSPQSRHSSESLPGQV